MDNGRASIRCERSALLAIVVQMDSMESGALPTRASAPAWEFKIVGRKQLTCEHREVP